jgi:hypothetical protein
VRLLSGRVSKLPVATGKLPTQRIHGIVRLRGRLAAPVNPASSIGSRRGREAWWWQALCRDALIFSAGGDRHGGRARPGVEKVQAAEGRWEQGTLGREAGRTRDDERLLSLNRKL